jgi:hypothetical protein
MDPRIALVVGCFYAYARAHGRERFRELNSRQDHAWGRCFTEDKAHKFAAWKRWNYGPMMLVVLSNPSDQDDYIPNRSLDNVVRFAHGEGFRGVEIVNAFSAVAGTSSKLQRLSVRFLLENNEHISSAVAHAGAIFRGVGRRHNVAA